MSSHKDKLPDSWFEPDQLLLLDGSFGSGCSKKEMKSLLDDVGIKWTIKSSDVNITKIITTKYGWTFKYGSNTSKRLQNLYAKLGNDGVYNPRDVMKWVKNLSAEDMSAYSEQILSLLKTMDPINIELAITMIADSMLEDKWIPWLRINKELDCVRALFKTRGLKLGQWHVSNTKWNFESTATDLQSRLDIPDEYLAEFMGDFYNYVKDN